MGNNINIVSIVANTLLIWNIHDLHVMSRTEVNNNKSAHGRQDIRDSAWTYKTVLHYLIQEAIMVKCCVASGCSRRQWRDNVSFHRFPSENGKNIKEIHKTKRGKWIAVVKWLMPAEVSSSWKTWEPSIYDRICSALFISGEEDGWVNMTWYMKKV